MIEPPMKNVQVRIVHRVDLVVNLSKQNSAFATGTV